MDIILQGYTVNQPTWLYLSCLICLTIFFRFNRVFSLRNLDLLLLLGISPALLIINVNPESILGYSWLFVMTTCTLVRVMLDSNMVRRPRVEPNLNSPGMLFLGIAAFAFLSMQAIKGPTSPTTAATVLNAEKILVGTNTNASDTNDSDAESIKTGPATQILATTVMSTSKRLVIGNDTYRGDDGLNYAGRIAARLLSILSHLAIVIGLYFMARWHFNDSSLGVSMATIYLLLPCTAYKVGELHHVLPTALLLWGILCYRYPAAVGVLIGLASGTMFFPLFTLPLWLAYYGKKQWLAFSAGVGLVWSLILIVMNFVSMDTHTFLQQMLGAINWQLLSFSAPIKEDGFYQLLFHPAYRIPVMVGYIILVVFASILSAKATLTRLIANLAAVIVGTQFWYPQAGGIYILWYLPLLLILVFRPRIVQRIDQHEHDQLVMTESKAMPSSDNPLMSRTTLNFSGFPYTSSSQLR
jgi:hypothetical protein